MAIQNNEGKACDAVVKILEKRTRKVRADVSCPEKTGIGPPVELRLHLGSQNYAVEHTQIEAFADQIHTAEEFGRFISPVTNELSGTLPGPAVYDLCFPIDTRLGVNAHKLDEIRDDFMEWVREQALRLHEKNPDRPTRERNPRGFDEQYRGTPPGFQVRDWAMPRAAAGCNQSRCRSSRPRPALLVRPNAGRFAQTLPG